MIERIQRRFALTRPGAVNLVKACVSCTISYLVIAMSIGILYFFTCDLIGIFRTGTECRNMESMRYNVRL